MTRPLSSDYADGRTFPPAPFDIIVDNPPMMEPAELKLYAVGYLARNRSDVKLGSDVLIATNDDEARAYAVRNVRSLYPECRGYYGHEVSISQVSEMQIELVFRK